MPKFPNTIHITEEGDKGEEWLEVHEDGVFDIDEAGKPVAVYQLVSVGRVSIQKQYIEAKRHKK